MLKKITIKNSLLWAILKLKTKNILSAQLDAEILLAHLLKKSKEFLYTYPEKRLTATQFNKYQNLIKRRLNLEPVAYLIGYKEFYGLNFRVNENVLIPRAETEMMVELVTCNLKYETRENSKKIIVDIGTGSGNIIISIAKNLIEQSKSRSVSLCHSRESGNPALHPEFVSRSGFRISARGGSAFGGKCGMTKTNNNFYQFYAIDNSQKALVIAQKNARLHGIGKKIKFIRGNLIEPILYNSKFLISARGGSAFGGHNSQIIITANLPYLTPRQYQQNKELYFEPKKALIGGKDGLEYIERFLQQIKKLLVATRKLSISVFVEIDPAQTKKIKTIIKKYFPQSKLQTKKDLCGRNRLLILNFN